MTPRAVELQVSGAFDAGFEVIGELASGQRDLAQSCALDDQEQLLKQRHLATIMTLPAVYQRDLLATYFPFEAVDRAQRAAVESGRLRFGKVAEFARTLNGFLERALDGLHALFSTGKWRNGRVS